MSDKPAINTSERLFDLVRYMRAELHEADLISDEEYFWLCSESPMANSPKGGSPSRERLEEYDEMRERIETLERENAAQKTALTKASTSLSAFLGFHAEALPLEVVRGLSELVRDIQPLIKP